MRLGLLTTLGSKIFNVKWGMTSERNRDEYILPAPRIELFKKIPIYSLPAAWNAAGDLWYHQNKTTFKIALKDKLFHDIDQA